MDKQFIEGQIIEQLKGTKIPDGFLLCNGENGTLNLQGDPDLQYIIYVGENNFLNNINK